MSNTLTNVIPVLVAQGLETLRSACVAPKLVNTDYSNDPANQGDTVNLWIPSAVAASAVSPSATPVQGPDINPVRAPIPLSQWRKAGFYMTDKSRFEVVNGLKVGQAAECVKSLAEELNAYVWATAASIYNTAGTPGTTPFASDVSAYTKARGYLNKARAPMADRRVVLGVDAETNALGLPVLTTFQNIGDKTTMTTGQIGTKLGADWYMDQQIPSQATATPSAGAITVNGAQAVGAGSTDNGRTGTLSLAKATNPTNLIAGDKFTIAGGTQTYVVLSAVTLAVGNTTVSIAPALQVATSGGEAVTVLAAHVMNLAFHRDAFGLVTRPIQALNANTERSFAMQDPITGLTLRLEVIRQNKQDYYEYDILYGAACVRPELGCIIAG